MVTQAWGALAVDVRWRATALAVAVICLSLVYKAAFTAAFGGSGPVPWVAALFVLPLLYAFPSPQRWLNRYRWPVLALQAVLTWVPLVLFGSSWPIGVGGLLAGLVLLMVGAVGSWAAAGLLLAADVVVRATVAGLQIAPGWPGAVWTVVTFIVNALLLFGMVRLAQIVVEVEQGHRQAGALAVARERLQAGKVLQAAVGQRLSGIAARRGGAARTGRGQC